MLLTQCGGGAFAHVQSVEGREIRAHRVLLSLISDKFRAMFSLGTPQREPCVVWCAARAVGGCVTVCGPCVWVVCAGFKEATQRVIEVPDKSYDVFLALLEHLYTGDSPLFGTSGDESRDFGFAVELLQVCPPPPNLLFVVVLPPVSQLMPVRLLTSTCWTAFARSASSTSHRLCETTPWCSCPTSLTVPTRLN